MYRRSGEPLLMQVLSPPHNYAPQEANTNDGPLALYASLLCCQKRSPQRQKGRVQYEGRGAIAPQRDWRAADTLVTEAARIASSYS